MSGKDFASGELPGPHGEHELQEGLQPLLQEHSPAQEVDKEVEWGTDGEVEKGGDFFAAKKTPNPWKERRASAGDGG